MTSLKRYLTRATRDWAVDNGYTPYVVVDANVAGVQVPSSFVENGRIVLNVHPRAIQNFDMDDEQIRFSARFSGKSVAVEFPLLAVLAVYARENGQGISFPEVNRAGEQPPEPDKPPTGPAPGKRPVLKIIK